MAFRYESLCHMAIYCLLFVIACPGKAQVKLSGEDNHLPFRPGKVDYWQKVIGVVDDPGVRTTGEWNEIVFRQSFPSRRNLSTLEDGATLERTFTSAGLVLVLETHRPYVYPGKLNDGLIEVSIDGEVTHVINSLTEASEIVLYRDRNPGSRHVRLRHIHAPNGGKGVSVIGFRELNDNSADLTFFLTGEAGDLLVDARITVLNGDNILRTVVQRNWMSGMIRLSGLPPGENYTLHIDALGWKSVTLPLPPLHAGSERLLTPVNLSLDEELLTEGFNRPRLGHPAVKIPGDSLNLHFVPREYENTLKLLSLRWVQTVGDARRSVMLWKGEIPVPAEGLHLSVKLPHQRLKGMGDLVADVQGPEGMISWRAPRSLQIRDHYPDQPVFLTLGHLDTWGHYQGEYLAAFADMANIINPDAVLISNEVHPAYVAAGLKGLQVPYLVTIGNHSFGYEQNPSFFNADGTSRTGPAYQLSVTVGDVDQSYMHREPHYGWRQSANRVFDRWYGDPIGVAKIGPDIAILNYGWSWEPEFNQEAIEVARIKFEPYRNVRIRVLNAYESEPTRDFLDHFNFALVHSAHAWPRARAMHADDPQAVRGHHFSINNGATTFIGKQSSDTYRVVRFADNRVESHSYAGHENQPWPLDRHRVAPLRVEYTVPVEQAGEPLILRARLINDYNESFDDCIVDLVLPKGRYEVTGGTMDHSWNSDDGKWTVLTIRVDAPANEIREIIAGKINR